MDPEQNGDEDMEPKAKKARTKKMTTEKEEKTAKALYTALRDQIYGKSFNKNHELVEASEKPLSMNNKGEILDAADNMLNRAYGHYKPSGIKEYDRSKRKEDVENARLLYNDIAMRFTTMERDARLVFCTLNEEKKYQKIWVAVQDEKTNDFLSVPSFIRRYQGNEAFLKETYLFLIFPDESVWVVTLGDEKAISMWTLANLENKTTSIVHLYNDHSGDVRMSDGQYGLTAKRFLEIHRLDEIHFPVEDHGGAVMGTSSMKLQKTDSVTALASQPSVAHSASTTISKPVAEQNSIPGTSYGAAKPAPKAKLSKKILSTESGSDSD